MTLIDLTRPARSGRRIDTLPVAIIGAGPIGLAAAANLIERGIPFELYEAGDTSPTASAGGATSACSRRGSIWWTPPRGACSRRPDGSIPPVTRCRRAPSWSTRTSRPLAALAPDRRAPAPASRCSP